MMSFQSPFGGRIKPMLYYICPVVKGVEADMVAEGMYRGAP